MTTIPPAFGLGRNKQLEEVEDHLRAVGAARQLLHCPLAHRNALNPISLIPPEVLAGIRDLPLCCVRGPGLFRRTESGLDMSHTRAPLLASSRSKRLVIWATIQATISGISENTDLIC